MDPDTTDPLAKADDAASRHDAQAGVDEPVQPCPLQPPRAALEALVVGDDERPLQDVAVELRHAGGEVLRTKTNRRGLARFGGLESGDYALCLYELDRAAWEALDTAPLEGESARSDRAAAWQSPPPDDARELRVRVEQGDSIASISQVHGWFPTELWNAPQNSGLRARREDMNVLLPGEDEVVVPAKRIVTTPAKTGVRHRLRRKGVPEVLKVRFLDETGRRGRGCPISARSRTRAPSRSPLARDAPTATACSKSRRPWTPRARASS
jgi:hypothetical protein